MTKQSEMMLGPLGVIEGGLIPCQGCGYALPGAAILCPVCGFERAPYPARTVHRYDWVLNQTLDSTAKLVLLALVSHDKPNGEGIYPSHARLAQLTGLGRRTVIDAIAGFGVGVARADSPSPGPAIDEPISLSPAGPSRVQELHSTGCGSCTRRCKYLRGRLFHEGKTITYLLSYSLPLLASRLVRCSLTAPRRSARGG